MDRSHYTVLAQVSLSYSVPEGRFPRVTHPCATKAEAFVRLACVRHAASVRSEPGSNSHVHPLPKLIAQEKVTRKFRSLAHLVTSRQSDAPSARLTNAQPQCLSTKARRTRPAARASLPRPIHSVKQQTANQAARLAKALNGAPKKSPHLNEGTRLIRPGRTPRQSSFDSPIRRGRRPGEALR